MTIENDTLKQVLLDTSPSEQYQGKESELANLLTEIEAMKGAEQNILYHREDVYQHTMMCMDHAALVKDMAADPLAFMLGTMLHDIGKPATAQKRKKRWNGQEFMVTQNIRHPIVGVPIAENVCRRIGASKELTDYIKGFVRFHDIVYESSRPREYLSDKKACRIIENAYNEGGHLPDYVLFSFEADQKGMIPGPKAIENSVERFWDVLDKAAIPVSVKRECSRVRALNQGGRRLMESVQMYGIAV